MRPNGEGRYDQMPEDDSTQEIVWSKINDKSQLEKLTGKEITPAKSTKDNKQAKERDKESKSTAGSNKEKVQVMIREEEKG